MHVLCKTNFALSFALRPYRVPLVAFQRMYLKKSPKLPKLPIDPFSGALGDVVSTMPFKTAVRKHPRAYHLGVPCAFIVKMLFHSGESLSFKYHVFSSFCFLHLVHIILYHSISFHILYLYLIQLIPISILLSHSLSPSAQVFTTSKGVISLAPLLSAIPLATSCDSWCDVTCSRPLERRTSFPRFRSHNPVDSKNTISRQATLTRTVLKTSCPWLNELEMF